MIEQDDQSPFKGVYLLSAWRRKKNSNRENKERRGKTIWKKKKDKNRKASGRATGEKEEGPHQWLEKREKS